MCTFLQIFHVLCCPQFIRKTTVFQYLQGNFSQPKCLCEKVHIIKTIGEENQIFASGICRLFLEKVGNFMKKRFLSVVLALSMILGMVPLNASAAETEVFAEPKVTGLSVSIDGGDPIDLLGEQPTVPMSGGSKPVFTVTFDNTELLNQVFVTSTKDNKTKYLEATLQNGKYVTDGYFDPSDSNYIPGTISVTYSKKVAKVDESGNICGTNLSSVKAQLTAQGISSRNETTDADGTVTAEIVLSDTLSGMADVYFDAAVSEFTAGAGIDQSELNRWLGVYQNLSKLSSYDLNGTDGKKFTLYLGDGKDFGDIDTYLVMVKDVTSNKYIKTLLKKAKAADKLGLDDISNALSSANIVSKKLLEYNAISKDTAALREEIEAHPTMSQQEKTEANEKITALDHDKKLFMIGMTAVSMMMTAAGGAPLMITALMAGYSTAAGYFWDRRVGMIKGCDPVNNAFSNTPGHGIPIKREYYNCIDSSGTYYIAEELWNSIQVSDMDNPAVDVTLCVHGYGKSTYEIRVNSGSTLHVWDCTYKGHEDSTESIQRHGDILVGGKGNLTMSNGVFKAVSCHDGSEAVIDNGIIEDLLMVFSGSKVTINDGQIGGTFLTGLDIDDGFAIVNGGEFKGIDNYQGTLTVNGGKITGNGNYGLLNRGTAIITNGNISDGIRTTDTDDNSATTTLLIDGNTDIQVSGTQAFNVTPIIKASAGYTGGVTYYSSADAQGVPMTIEQAAKIDYTLPYVRLVADGAISNPDCQHSYTTVTTSPTCTERGYTTYTCSKCGHSYQGDYTNALGHRFGEWIVIKEATSTTSGTRERVCSVCQHKETDTIPATGTPSTPSGGSTGGGSYTPPSSSTTTTTTKNEDGSTTIKTENKTTGTVTETTKNPDGSQTVVETKKDGTVTTTETDKAGNKSETVAKADGSSVTKVDQKDGTTATVNIDTVGKVEAEVKLPEKAVTAAQDSNESITLPIPEVKVTASAETAPVVTVKTGSEKTVKVVIPTTEITPGTVAVIVKANGTEEVVKTSVATEEGLTVALPDGATVRIVDNSKKFTDVPADNWAADAVSFSSARELFSGTSKDTFSPNTPMTRAMMMTVLARLDGEDTSGGNSWYEKGMNWAVDNGISDGRNPNSNITREQLTVMLWRYAGSPASNGRLDGFSDADSISAYAQEAMRWAVENKIINGFGNGRLGPQSEATRAQVAQMLKNFLENQ